LIISMIGQAQTSQTRIYNADWRGVLINAWDVVPSEPNNIITLSLLDKTHKLILLIKTNIIELLDKTHVLRTGIK